jgi:hypothetical protein
VKIHAICGKKKFAGLRMKVSVMEWKKLPSLGLPFIGRRVSVKKYFVQYDRTRICKYADVSDGDIVL